MDISIKVTYKSEGLQKLRKAAGLSQSQLADLAGIKVQVLQQYERGARDINGAKLPTLLKICNALECRLADIITDGLNRYSTNPEKLNSYLEVHSGIALAGLRKRLYYLSVIVTMAPLLGLLGTISGMISSFSVFNLESGQATAITGGVGEALIATAMGLCVAIIALIVHSYYTQRIDAVVTDMEQCFSLIEDNRADFAETSMDDIQSVSQKAGAAA